MATPYDGHMPTRFVVKRNVNGREGYIFFRGTIQVQDAVPQVYLKLSSDKHRNRYYNIMTDNIQTDWRRCNIVKNGGTVQRAIEWRNSQERLHYQGQHWPVLQITQFEHFPAWHHQTCFAPITTPVQNNPAQLPAPAPAPAPALKQIAITTIPQHAVRALLTQALYSEDNCPILDVPIDVSNGAVTSCFHIFEKTAIEQWLRQPGSGQKCPVCNQPCNSYALQNEVEELVEIPNDN